MEENIAIKIDNVSKDFFIPHEKNSTLKSAFTTMLKINKAQTETQHALRNVSLQIRKGEFFGIVGRNGSGKSTLLKMIAGIYQPTKGSIKIHGKLVPFIELGVGFNAELTGKENIYLNGAMVGFSKKEIEDMYDDIVGFAELERFMDQKLKNYSSGMQVRLAFSLATRARADILLVDEVLAVGDADFQRKCLNYFRTLKRDKKTVVFVSHDMSTIREYCDRAILIEKSKVLASGSANKIADKYGHLFLDSLKIDNLENNKLQQRWGDGSMQFIDPKCVPINLTRTDEKITILTNLIIKENIEEAIVGFAIKNSSETLITGSNNKLLKQKLTDLKKGQQIHFEWEIPNILNDGDYYVNLSAETSYAVQSDVWEEAIKFTVIKNSRTGFFVVPDIKLKINYA